MQDSPRSVIKTSTMAESRKLNVTESGRAVLNVRAERVTGFEQRATEETLVIEEPLEIRLGYESDQGRAVKSISVTMRTPGDDFELAAGFLMTEGVVRDVNDIERISNVDEPTDVDGVQSPLPPQTRTNIVRVDLAREVKVSLANLERNFYMTSSCGICGKASLQALRSVCPPRRSNTFSISAEILHALPSRLRAAQPAFEVTGGLHGAGLFHPSGDLAASYEDVGRHNAVDKLLGAEFLADRTPLRESLLLLSGRASFELMQKALMGGIPMVASVGAPSSLAVQVSKEFDIILVGFLRSDHFNVYHGSRAYYRLVAHEAVRNSMKLRIRGNSLRLRISRSELESLLRGNRIEETIHFTASPEAKLTYALDSAVQSTPITIQYESQAVTVTLSKDQAVVWGSESEVGVYGELDNGGTHLLEVIVEKDFACLDGSDEDNIDTFANPHVGATPA